MDWGQVVANGGPPCFFVEGPQFCGRAERWQGHGNSAFHEYVSLQDFITAVQSSLAKQVLDEIVTYKGIFALVQGVEGGVIDVACNQIDQRLRNLFARLNLDVSEGGLSHD
jgi:hypothetical protein